MTEYIAAASIVAGGNMAGYPFTDSYGDKWIDASGYIPKFPPRSGKCFVCQQFTNRMDIDYSTWFCNGTKCNKTIADNLKVFAQDAIVADVSGPVEAWENEGGNGTHNRQ